MINNGQYRKVNINGLEYIYKEDFIKQLEDRIEQCRRDYEADSEAQVAIEQVIQSLYRI